jgi:hypothetical protein
VSRDRGTSQTEDPKLVRCFGTGKRIKKEERSAGRGDFVSILILVEDEEGSDFAKPHERIGLQSRVPQVQQNQDSFGEQENCDYYQRGNKTKKAGTLPSDLRGFVL